MAKLDNKVAVVTGAGRGIGRAIARALADAGATVGLIARTQSELEMTRSEIAGGGHSVSFVAVDVSDSSAATGALQALETELGPIDILVNNAAVIWPMGPATAINPDEWAKAMEINLIAPARLSFTVIPGMVDRGFGRIVNVSSGVVGAPNGPRFSNAYGTSKVALEAHTRNLAAELSGTGVTVNALWPGAVDTEMQAWVRSQRPEDVGAEVHAMFLRMKAADRFTPVERPAAVLVEIVTGDATGEVFDAAS